LRRPIKKVLDAARTDGHRQGMDNPAVWKGHLEHKLSGRYSKADQVGHKEMPFEAIPAFVAELSKLEDNTSLGLLFVTLSANRSGEVRGMVWDELDLDAGRWMIPAERMKAEKEHVVTLSR